MISIRDEGINEFELMIVLDKLKQQNVSYASIYRGNDCVWVASGSSSCPLNQYFIFREGKLVDVQVD